MIEIFGRGVDHDEVGRRVLGAGQLGGGYVMMTALSAAIAILGLLLSSPAVVIGAMLLSPLMGPIILLGFSFSTVDWPATRKALISLAVGFGVALAVSVGLTLVSPLKEPTAEILARAHPTLFDLMVAIFSGIAGGYAVVRQRGETVIGVAIATALMPPLAVVGFGAGTGAWTIAGGALLLFFTNLLAIALAAAIMASLNGFRPRMHLGRREWMSHAAVLAILAILCVPLTVGLRTIARESRATTEARAEVARLFGPKARVASLFVRDGGEGLEVEGLVATPMLKPKASTAMADDLRAKLKTAVRVSLDQVVLADPSHLQPQAALEVAPAPRAAVPNAALAAAEALRAAVPFAGSTTSYDAARDAGLVRLATDSPLDLRASKALEDGLRRQGTAGQVEVVPPLRLLPPIPIALTKRGAATLGSTDLQVWALARWRASSVQARICRGGVRGVRRRDVAVALVAAFAPLAVTIAPSSRGCPESAHPAFVEIDRT